MSDHPDRILATAAEKPLRGELTPPGDKSISHRAIMLAALAEGQSHIRSLLRSKDVEATAEACEQMGAEILLNGDNCTVNGVGINGLQAPDRPLDMGNSGTAMRLLSGVLAGQSFDSVLTGDESLRSRPMNRIARPLREMGAVVETSENGCAPIRISGGRPLSGIHYQSPVASAQIKSCVLLAGMYARGATSVSEPTLSRDHTERMLKTFGADITDESIVRGGSSLTACDLEVPADISSAAFSMAAAALVPESRIVLKNIGINPTRDGLLNVFNQMGCELKIQNQRDFGAEPVADIEVSWCARLKAVEVGEQQIPAMIDEFPVLMVLAALAKGTTKIRGARELRFKESDRISVMAAGLTALGFKVKEFEDGIDIEGQSHANATATSDSPVLVNAAGDHRCAMSFAVIAQVLDTPVMIRGAEHIDTSYPGFLSDFQQLGASARRWEG